MCPNTLIVHTINSYRHKYEHVVDLLQKNVVDILFLSEIKIDESFSNAMFNVDIYSLYRADGYQHGTSLTTYTWSDLACDSM